MMERNSQRKCQWQRIFAWAMALAMVLNLFPVVGFQEARADDTGGQPVQSLPVANPQIVEDSTMQSGQKVTWDCLWFGSYPQTEVEESEALLAANWNDNGDAIVDGVKYRRITREDTIESMFWPEGAGTYRYFRYEPIKWRVLSVNEENGTAFCLADAGLDCQLYHNVHQNVTWKTSTIRSWLNGYTAAENQLGTDYSTKNFINSAFSNSEKSAIVESSIVNLPNVYYGTPSGDNTEDYVFLLSESEIGSASASSYGFVTSHWTSYNEALLCKATDFANAMGVYAFGLVDGLEEFGEKNCIWWLRSPGGDSTMACFVNHDSSQPGAGYTVAANSLAVRPAMNVDLSSDVLQYGGTVESDGTVDERPYVMPKEDIASAKVSVEGSFTYNGEAHTPKPIVEFEEIVLTEGVDYTLSYEKNTNRGTAKVIVAGIGAFKGTTQADFEIFPATIDSVDLSQTSFEYSGTKIEPEFTVYAGELVVPEGSYTVEYANNIDVGSEATVLVKAKDESNFTGEASTTFEIVDSGTGGEEQKATYTVELYYMQKYGIWPTKPQKTLKLEDTIGKEVSFNPTTQVRFSDSTWEAKERSKKTYKQSTYKKSTLKGKVTANGSLTLKVYYDIASGPDPCFWDVTHAKKPDGTNVDWYCDTVHDVNDLGLITGYEKPIKNGLKPYGPRDKITRAQIVVILWRMSGTPSSKYTPFKDVKQFDANGKENYYWMALRWGREMGVANGYGEKREIFKPDGNVTREELATFLRNYALKIKKIKTPGSESDYSAMTDKGDVTPYAKETVGWCFKNKILEGTKDTKEIKPKGNATRGDAAKMFRAFYRLLEKE